MKLTGCLLGHGGQSLRQGPCSPLSMPLAWCSTPQMARISGLISFDHRWMPGQKPVGKERRSWLQPTPTKSIMRGDVMGAGLPLLRLWPPSGCRDISQIYHKGLGTWR